MQEKIGRADGAWPVLAGSRWLAYNGVLTGPGRDPMADAPSRTWDAFLCYSTADAGRVAHVDRTLREAGLDVWWDRRQVPAGSVIVERIQEGLAGSRWIVLCLSDAMLASDWCGAEAHAVHPNYADRHEPQHMPRLNAGPVIKINTQQRYATNAETAALFEALCQDAEVPVQKFVNRTDLACGTTIGPISAARLGVRTVDVGNPMWSMHSIRETGGAEDPPRMVAVMKRFFEHG